MASFFEKLTGAEESPEGPIKEGPKDLAAKPAESKRGPKKTIKKENISMPRLKKDSEEISLIEPKIEEPETEEKDWLEEADSEEGQLTIDVYQTDEEIVIKSTVAGVNPDDIDIDINNDMVTIKGKRAKDEKIETENYFYQELYWGVFSRSVILPAEVDSDKARASIKNGILTIRLPKLEKIKTKKIKVKFEV
ncbi:Hsp20/alpha crystallin family protein [Patescibacteria group bacterium]|nr:Hsp20/alpha crystallin family protein [Patescibacteria group bacterium]